MTLQDKIAALPPMPEPLLKPEPRRSGEFNMIEYWQMVAAGYEARNALLCEALETLLFHHDAACSSVTACKVANDVSDVLAACEVTP